MDVALGVLAGILITVVVAACVVWLLMRRVRAQLQPLNEMLAAAREATDKALEAAPPVYKTLDEGAAPPLSKTPLPVVQSTCAGCTSFDLVGGQKIMAMNPAFRAAAEVIPPWRMGRALKRVTNPEHVDLVAKIAAETDVEKRRALEHKLETIPAEIAADPEDQVEANLLGLEWSQFGACTKHSELRASSDTCDAWTSRLQS